MMVLNAELKSTKRIHRSIGPWFVQMLEDVVQSYVDCIRDDGGAFEAGGDFTQLQRSVEDQCEDG